jgi:cytochrome P450
MHHNPKYFPEPEKFKPERFLKTETESENNFASQFSYLPFGGGQRQCIGMRFAMSEIKIGIAKLLAEFKIVDTPKTEINLLPGDFFVFSYDDVHVKLEKRIF